MAERTQWHLQAGQYLGEVSALCFLHLPQHVSSCPYLLAGSGSQMLLYDLEAGNLLRSFHVFKGIRVHGIVSSFISHIEGPLSSLLAFKIAVFGERRVKLFNMNIEIAWRTQNEQKVCVNLVLLHLLPKLSHWVLDAAFLKGFMNSLHQGICFLALGRSDNSVSIWDIQKSSVVLEAQCPERTLLYSMRLWGEELDSLCIASGTIYNEIILWKFHQECATYSEGQAHRNHGQQYGAVKIRRLVGHEGSIFRIAWSSDGSKLVSVSDDRSARIWTVCFGNTSSNDRSDSSSSDSVGRVLFGHNARVWDCCVFESIFVTAGEDCTCRIWDLDCKQIEMFKEHVGRGIWRCLYDPISSLLVTAGFDAAIKVHQVSAHLSRNLKLRGEGEKEFIDRTEIFTAHIPNSSVHGRFMDSKSEYVRCLCFASEDVFYVATNHGYLYHAKLSKAGNVEWTELAQVSKGVPIICMDLLSVNQSEISTDIGDWIAVGDGKGSMSIFRVDGDAATPKARLLQFNWSAELERRLLGTHWCKSLGHRYIFTADPKGMLKLWKLSGSLLPASDDSVTNYSVSLIAEFLSCFGMRIMCLDASFEEEVLVCGDLRGNIVLFPLSKRLLLGGTAVSEFRIAPINDFRGAHGISGVTSISLDEFNSNQIEIHSTGGDGCICFMEYDRDQHIVEFIGMKQVKELSLIEAISSSTDANFAGDSCRSNYAIGFTSADFIIWNLRTETKVIRVSCGGWRRPHSYHLGDMPEMKNCFAYVKDDIIYIRRHWVSDRERKIFPRNLHEQFHGREMHCLCFVGNDSESGADRICNSTTKFIATGCEDGTVRLTRYTPGNENWSASKLLGEHVGGSAVRSICFVSKIHTVVPKVTDVHNGGDRQIASSEDGGNPFLLISVGAKQVLTCWILKNRNAGNKEELSNAQNNETVNGFKSSADGFSSMSFKWLSTDMPTRNSRKVIEDSIKKVAAIENKSGANARSLYLDSKEMSLNTSLKDIYANDWRYMAVTSFLVKNACSRISVCFVVVASSDATLTLRALILPYRLWFDVALLVPLSSPVLALQHVIVPVHLSSEDISQLGNAFIVISGSTDGSIAFWDLSESITAFMQQVSTFHVQKSLDCQKRPRTGRGSQGGRLSRSLHSIASKQKSNTGLATVKAGERNNMIDNSNTIARTLLDSSEPENSRIANSQNTHASSPESKEEKNDFSFEIFEIQPLQVLNNVHRSGVNCIHVSEVKDKSLDFGSLYVVISGGDDQSLQCIGFNLASRLSMHPDSDTKGPDVEKNTCRSVIDVTPYNLGNKYIVRFLYRNSVASAHSSAVKGIWTDGNWVFSTGLDQRVRCWKLEEYGKLTETCHLIVSVPEPEALDARACDSNCYQIAVAGRGMQIVKLATSTYPDVEE